MNLRHLLHRGGVIPLVVVALAASCLLGWNLGAHYLWQDEAATAVLAERMMRFGKPLGFDGRNLITMDSFDPAESESIQDRTGDSDAAIRFYVERGDFRHDTTWIGQPWGQFILAGVSLRLLGHGTVQARLPFVATAVLSVVLLYLLVRRRFRDPLMAAISVGLLLANVFWVLHARQCRYYAPSTLFLLLTLIAYLRWQDLRPWGATLFVAAAWCFFQQDYGTFWPVLAVLGVDAAVAARRNWPRVALVFGALLATITPWIWYYQLFGRLKETSFPWSERFLGTLFNLNQFQLPLVLVPILAWLLWRARADQRPVQGLGGVPVARQPRYLAEKSRRLYPHRTAARPRDLARPAAVLYASLRSDTGMPSLSLRCPARGAPMKPSRLPSLTITASLVLLVACGGVATGPPTTFEQAKTQAASRGVPVLLDFYTDW